MRRIFEAVYGLGKGYATKIGLVGAFLGAIGAILAEFAQTPCQDVACWLDLVTQLGAALAIFGGARKVVSVADAKGA